MASFPRRSSRPTLALVVTVASSLLVVLAAFLPWVSSGENDRNSFELARSAERLGVLTGATRHAAALWYFVPLLGAFTWIAATLGRNRIAAALGAVIGALALAAWAIVTGSALKIGPGVPMAGIAGVASLGGALALAVAGGRRR